MNNPAKIIDELFAQFSRTPGFRDFMQSVSVLSSLASTPGWQDRDGKPTQPGAKPIGLAQWGDAQMIAGLITQAVKGAPWPEPGIDTDDAGVILMQWKISDTAQLDLEIRSSLSAPSYRWTAIRDGVRGERRTSRKPSDVVEALRSVMVGAS